MLESYEEGQRITRDDLSSDYYMPIGEWAYANVEYVGDNAVELVYYDNNDQPSERLTMSKDDFEKMLGWDIEKGEQDEELSPPEIDEIVEAALHYPIKVKRGSYELLRGPRPIFVKVSGDAHEKVEEIHAFDSHEECREAFNAITRR